MTQYPRPANCAGLVVDALQAACFTLLVPDEAAFAGPDMVALV
jgi:hypothetical protein